MTLKKPKLSFASITLLFAVIIYAITAFNSNGFHHADEHYQIIEFAGVKSGTHQASDLAWEYKAQIRSTIQPTLCYVIFSCLEGIGINNPYHKAFFLRLLTALLALVVMTCFIKNTQQFITNKKLLPAYYVLTYFLWFLPYLSVRFSSETWGGLWFVLALSIYFGNTANAKKPIVMGLLLGISFLFRYQMALAFIGLFLWLVFIAKPQLSFFFKLISSILAMMFVGFLIDCWFYGDVVITLWKYFYVNIVENVAASFGEEPWSFYVKNMLFYPHFLVGGTMIMALLALLWFKPKHVFLWCIIAFVGLHSIINHKEIRFLFPLAYLIPVVMVLAVDQWQLRVKQMILKKGLPILFVCILIIPNTIGLVAFASKGAGIGRMDMTRYLHQTYGKKDIHLIYCSWANPYNPWHSKYIKYYQENSMTDTRIKNLCDLNDSLIVPNKVNFLIIRNIDLTITKCQDFIQHNGFVLEKSSIPEWMVASKFMEATYVDKNILLLYKHTKN